jgi:hypothetical protein
MSQTKVYHISQVSDKTAITIAAELSAASRYGDPDAYNLDLIGAALHLVAQGGGHFQYIGSTTHASHWGDGGNPITVPHTTARENLAQHAVANEG